MNIQSFSTDLDSECSGRAPMRACWLKAVKATDPTTTVAATKARGVSGSAARIGLLMR
jgi:hypothetical protein